jgi:acetolactate synthase small subunit
MENERWVFVIKVQDKPGALTAIASVFSSRGVSLQTTLGSSATSTPDAPSTIVLSFRATERKKDTLLRTLSRLQQVTQVQAYPYGSRELRSIAITRVAPEERMELPARGIQTEIISERGDSKTMLITGSTQAVDKAVEALRERGTLLDAVTTVMAV